MTDLANQPSEAHAQAAAYTAALLAALGPRDPLMVLAATPAAVRAVVDDLPPAQLAALEAPGKWSMLQVLQHLADSDLVVGYRFRMILAHDRPPLLGYDQELWVERLHREDDDLEEVLDRFTLLRRSNVRLLEKTSPVERQRVGLHAERGEESVDQLMRLVAGHDLVHLRQLERISRAVGVPSSGA